MAKALSSGEPSQCSTFSPNEERLKPDGYYSKDDMRHHQKTKKSDIDNAMCRKMDDFIGGLDDETVLAAVDIHM